MFAFYLPNHKSQRLISVEMSGLITMEPKGHPSRWPDKAAMLRWAHDESTDHCFYSFAEPRDANRRLNTKDNPVVKLHGLVADYDSKISPALLEEALKKMPADFPLAYHSKTFSGGARFVWQFEHPVAVVSAEIAKSFLKRLAKEMKLVKLLPGFDEGAFLDPARPFELGHEWATVNQSAVVAGSIAQRFLFESASKTTFDDAGPTIPIEEVATEVERRWPGRWSGPFAVGSQGVRFWDSKADNPQGAWIRDTGVVAFTGEGRFMPWAEILGTEFVSRFEADRIGTAIADIYYDGRAYWCKNALGEWDDYPSELLRNHLRVRGLAAVDRRGGVSEIDRAMDHVSFNCRVSGGFPRLFCDRDVYNFAGMKYLNISRVRAMPPADGLQEWGKNFPWIAQYIDGLFHGIEKDVFLSWHKHFWWSAFRHNLKKGHALFIGGVTGIGKTLLNLKIIGASVGGNQEATAYLTGQTEFNHALLSSAHWNIDDATILADRNTHDKYSQNVKRIVANPQLTYRRMYANPVTAEWLGRIVVTLNIDAISIQMLPSVDGSIVDKIIFLLANKPDVDFHDAEKKIAEELPYYLGFLRDYVIPAHLLTDPDAVRFGLNAYKNDFLLAEAKSGSSSGEFSDLLQMWKDQYFRLESKATEWEGTAHTLYDLWINCETIKEIMRGYIRSPKGLSRLLTQASADGGFGVTSSPSRSNRGRRFTILK